jgi:hypothetical protein
MTQNLLTRLNEEFATFPCKANSKQPATRNGYKDARKGVNISDWTQRGLNVGIACDLSGIFVLDCDYDPDRGLNGVETLRNIEVELGALPQTLTQCTPRGGRHYIFSNEGIINPRGKIGCDIDCKYHGYILAYPSQIDGRQYTFVDETAEIAALPKTWLDYINKISLLRGFAPNTTGKSPEREIFDGDFQKMFTQCQFIRHCVEAADILNEPEWHLFACVLNSLSNGEELFDYYSQPHSDYDRVSTQKKFQNAKKYNVTCDTICSVFEGCKQCNHNN